MVGLLIALTAPAHAINFAAPIPIAMGKGTVVMLDGTEHTGKITGKLRGQSALASVNVKTDGGKLKLTPDAVKKVSMKPGGLTQLVGTIRGGSSVREIQNTTYGNQIVYDQITMPDGDVILLQLVNPGFDSVLKVYADPSFVAQESSGIKIGGVKLSGGIPGSLYVKPAGEVDGLRRIERPNYSNLAAALFDGVCPGYLLGEAQPDYLNMPDHVLAVHEQCGTGGDDSESDEDASDEGVAEDDAAEDDASEDDASEEDAAPEAGEVPAVDDAPADDNAP